MKFQREQIPSRPVLIRLAIATEPLKRSFYSRRYKRNLDFHSSLCKRFRTQERKNTKRWAFSFLFSPRNCESIVHRSPCKSSFRSLEELLFLFNAFYFFLFLIFIRFLLLAVKIYSLNLIFKIVDRRLKFRGDCWALWEDEVRLCWWPVSSYSRLHSEGRRNLRNE